MDDFSRNEPPFATFCWKADQTPKHGCFLEKLQVLAKWTIFQQQVSHFVKKHEKSSIWPKLATLRGNYHVSGFWSIFQQKVGKSGSFREKERNIIDLAESCNFSKKLPCFRVLVNFSAKRWKKWLISWKMPKNHRFGLNLQLFEETTMFRRFYQLFSKKLQKVAHFVKEHEKSWIWQKLATFRANYHVSAFWWTFQQKVAKSASFRQKTRKTIDLAKTCNFSSKLRCLGIFMNFSERSCKKLLNSWKSTKNHRFGQNFATFRTNYQFFAFRWTFQEKVAKSASFRETARKTIDLAKTLQLLEQTIMSLHFDELFDKQLQKLPHFVKKLENSSIWPKLRNFFLQSTMFSFFDELFSRKWLNSWESTKNHRFGQFFGTFRTNYYFFAFRWTFQEKIAKSASFREKTRKTIDLAKTCNFLSKLRCLGIFMNFSERSCKKLLNSWKSPKNHRFGQNFASFRTNYHVFAFRSTFREKVAKSASFRETARKIIDLANALILLEQATSFSFWWTFKKKVAKSASSREKARKMIDFVNLQLSEKTTMFWRFDEHCSKKLQKAARAVRKHEKSSIWPNLCNFSKKLLGFCISMNFQGKSCQKCFVSWKSTKNHRFGQNFATFRANYHVLAFRWSFQQKVPHFVKKHGKSSIWRKLATFPTNYHVLTLWWTFQRKVAESASFPEKTLKIIDWAKTCNFFEQSTMFMPFDELFSKRLQKVPRFVKKHEKSSIWPKLATFRANYDVLAFLWTFQKEVAKSCSIREKARKIIDLAKTLQLFEQTTKSLHFDELLRKKLQKVAQFVKKHEKSSIWPKLCNFSNKLPCLCISINFSGKSCKKCLISWNSTENHWFGQCFDTFGTSYVFFLLMNFQEKSCKKCVVSRKSTKYDRFCQLATFRENYHVLTFRWTLQQKVAKSCSCREKARKIINLAKSLQLFEKTSRFLHFDEFSRKKLPKVLRFVKKHEKSSIWPKLCNF